MPKQHLLFLIGTTSTVDVPVRSVGTDTEPLPFSEIVFVSATRQNAGIGSSHPSEKALVLLLAVRRL